MKLVVLFSSPSDSIPVLVSDADSLDRLVTEDNEETVASGHDHAG